MRPSRFLRRNRGSIAVLSAAALGVVALGLGAAVEVENIRRVRSAAQSAIDTATLTAARKGAEDFAAAGEAMFEANFTTNRATVRALLFKNPEKQLFSGEARLQYRPLFLSLLGVSTMGVDVEAFVSVPEEEGGPACIVAGEGGVEVRKGVTVQAGDCALVSAQLQQDGATLNMSGVCTDGCDVSNPYQTVIAQWIQSLGTGTPCDQTLPLKADKRVVEKSYSFGPATTEDDDDPSSIYAWSGTGARRFCEYVEVKDDGVLHFFGERALFVEGFKIQDGGRIDASGTPGSTLVLGANTSALVEKGGTFAVIAPASGPLAGVAVASAGPSTNGEVQTLEIRGGGHLHIEGMVHMPDKHVIIEGPATLNDPGDPLAIVARSLSLRDAGLVIAMDPDLHGPGAPMIGDKSLAPRLVNRAAR